VAVRAFLPSCKNHRGGGFETNCLEKKRGFELFGCLGQGDTSVPETTHIRVVKLAARMGYKYSNKKTAVKFTTGVTSNS
jgi:hypothetical protein